MGMFGMSMSMVRLGMSGMSMSMVRLGMSVRHSRPESALTRPQIFLLRTGAWGQHMLTNSCKHWQHLAHSSLPLAVATAQALHAS
eukprot:scaffold114913_cov17-Tisochrysis_lutea.AAC.1